MFSLLSVKGLSKTFVLHTQGGVALPVLSDIELTVNSGECVVLNGPSGAGKSTLLRCIFGNYRVDRGKILIDDGVETIDVAAGNPRQIIELRRRTVGYVSQFLRVVPRVSTLDVVSEPLRLLGVSRDESEQRAGDMLRRLRIPKRLWSLPPATFSGGEQQRVNVARGLIVSKPLLLLDEPTASLDAENRDTVVQVILETIDAGTAIVGIFHDAEVRDAVATRTLEMSPVSRAAA
ncbi:MAG: phosphonate C-P lyase system protein PhnL [Pseudomonadota bacterium]|nr:phosphonate C-P lyase system protein PhnL [Pseudomonadota bacterium]MEC8137103.1 phosphonate C-P lyase system protein PhnL [Pseudomonadota bacterium]